jgi:uncharacterized protein YbjT (DUF2867 family)
MAASFLIVGATGNTGQRVVETLSADIKKDFTFANYTIIALTRSKLSGTAQRLSKLPNLEFIEQTWSEITPEWLREHNVKRVFIAAHNQPNQFAEESTFHLAALHAGVEYVVRISTTAANVRPDYEAYYPRQHWAIETMLSTPEFKALKWTSLQPNVFSTFYLGPAAEFVKEFRKTGKQGTLGLMASEDGSVGIIEPSEIGTFAARLLLTKDITKHNNATYVLNGPEDINGKQIKELVEKTIGEPVKDVKYKDLSFLERMADASKESRNVIMSIRFAPVTAWNGECTASTTSKEVLEIAPPRIGPHAVFESLLKA